MATNFFKEVKTLDELKKSYHKLCRKYHPDMGGDVETMQKINSEYDEMIKYFATHGNKTEKERASKEVPEKFRKIIEKLIHFSDIRIEIIGGWIWLDNCGKYLRKIQSMGFQYSVKQKRYYLADDETKGGRASRYSMNRIRDIYGSQFVDTVKVATLTC